MTTYHPAVTNLKQILLQEWALIDNHEPLLKRSIRNLLLYHLGELNRSKTCLLERNYEGIRNASQPQNHRGKFVGLSRNI